MKNYLLFILLLGTFCTCSPVFDTPPLESLHDVKPNTSIMELKRLHEKGQFEKIADEKIISGIIIANDKAGNFFKQIILQDSTGGIALKIDDYNLFVNYPEGMRVSIKCKDLILGDYHGLIQLGGSIDDSDPYSPSLAGIPKPLLSLYVIKGSLNNAVIPKVINRGISPKMMDTLQNTLVKFYNMEFAVADRGKTYADVSKEFSALNYVLNDCDGKTVTLRTSSYATFANVPLREGNGTITAVYTLYETTGQLYIRDTSDIQFSNSRCSLFDESFENCAKDNPIDLQGWQNIAETGGVYFKGNIVSNNGLAEISGRGISDNRPELTSWLIMPAINIAANTNPKLSFETKDGYATGATLTACVSEGYSTGTVPSSAQWTELNATISSEAPTNGYSKDFVYSGDIELGAFAGKNIYIAFRYDGANPTAKGSVKKTTVFRLDNVKVRR